MSELALFPVSGNTDVDFDSSKLSAVLF